MFINFNQSSGLQVLFMAIVRIEEMLHIGYSFILIIFCSYKMLYESQPVIKYSRESQTLAAFTWTLII